MDESIKFLIESSLRVSITSDIFKISLLGDGDFRVEVQDEYMDIPLPNLEELLQALILFHDHNVRCKKETAETFIKENASGS